MDTRSPGTAADCLARECAELVADDDAIAAAVGGHGFYSTPRECACGKSHTSRDLYWRHRLERERELAEWDGRP